MSKITEHVGQRIRTCRKKKGYTIEEFSKMINKSKATLSKYENGSIAIDIDTLLDIAEALGIHESSVSRVTAQKYMACSRGVFELKYFFSQGLESRGGDDTVSAQAVRRRIRELIEAEKKEKRLNPKIIYSFLSQSSTNGAVGAWSSTQEVEGTGFENQQWAQAQPGFKSLLLRHNGNTCLILRKGCADIFSFIRYIAVFRILLRVSV